MKRFKAVPALVAMLIVGMALFLPSASKHSMSLPGHQSLSDIYAQAGPSFTAVIFPGGSDPCMNPSIDKQSAVINISTATTTELVAAVAGKTVTVCALNFSTAGTTPSALFKTGTKVTTACDTTPTSISGTELFTTGTFITETGDGGLMNSIVGGEICVTSGGTTPSFQGTITYAQL